VEPVAETAEAPAGGRLWVARAPSRDFRRATWESLPARRDGDALAGEVDPPADGCLALFGEADFKEGERTFGLSTAVRIAGGR
jgi:PhoPQ-activated pathogenicity-related protein